MIVEVGSKAPRDVFLAAVKLPPDQWQSFLDKACGGDDLLRNRVRELLDAHQMAGSFLQPAGERQLTAQFEPNAERPGTVIGPYKLLEQIGEGGMGVVFMAEQTRPVQRRVALKIIKAGMDTRQVVARFEAERQALAMMDHPNIARVLDVEATDTGRPYFVMELVRGVPMTEFCDDKNLSIRERLELFVTVCQAVQHAHQKGIIHRDIKPTNVLVTLHDGRPVIKVIDFGVAKATGQKLTDKTLFTGFTQMIGTPLYMSPEQAEMSGLDVDTRSDIFSAGVLLYELLTGTTPFDSQRLKSASFDELRRIIREEEPPRPSTRLTTLALEAASTVGTQRRSDPRHLSRLFRGELDWIVMKCLEKDRTRRYETASALAGDVERYLHDEPVQACPPSARYRFGKFTRRNKAALVTAAIVMVALGLGTVVSTWQAIRAYDAEAQARTDEAKAKTAETQAKSSEQKADAALDFIVTAFRSPEPDRDGRTVTVVEVLDRAAKALQHKFADDPVTRATLLKAIANCYAGLGQSDKAIPLYEQTRDLHAVALGRDNRTTLRTRDDLAYAYCKDGRLNAAIALGEETLQLARAKLGPDDPTTLEAMSTLSHCYLSASRLDEALRLHEETLRFTKAKLGPDHIDTLDTMGNLAISYGYAGRFDEAVQLAEEVFKGMKSKFGPDDPNTLDSMMNLEIAYQGAGRFDEAIKLGEEALKGMKSKSDEPPLKAMGNLAESYRAAGRFDEALRLNEETLGLMKAKLGPDDRDSLVMMGNLATSYRHAGRFDEALHMGEEALKRMKSKLGPDHPDTLEMMDNLAETCLHVNRLAEAEPLARECLAIREKKGPDEWWTFSTRSLLGGVLMAQKKYAEAEPLLVSGHKGMRERAGKMPADEKTRLKEAIQRLVQLYEATNRPDKAAEGKAKLAEFDKANPGVPKKDNPPAKKAESATAPNSPSPSTNEPGK